MSATKAQRSEPAPTLEEAARTRRAAEEARSQAVRVLMRAVRAHEHLGPTEIARRLTAAGWPIRRGQVYNLLRGRTRW